MNNEKDLVYKNLMEIIVMDKLKEVQDDLDCCKCDQCMMDIANVCFKPASPKIYRYDKRENLFKSGCAERTAYGGHFNADHRSVLYRERKSETLKK